MGVDDAPTVRAGDATDHGRATARDDASHDRTGRDHRHRQAAQGVTGPVSLSPSVISAIFSRGFPIKRNTFTRYAEIMAAPASRRLGRAGLEAPPRSAYADGS